ncbi:hypothetical protein P4U43_06690 [Arthrobacter sp. EH-1B-1]|uniref:Uncharacterized protein n=1 Tax=Arthrobacter vasquezii TaxID=2977629 RepID=A0ABT6CTX3_9MICC|nr:hypothetical protein [Arthrobacter vasquezii]MDF9277479.1 hypothetical protein [Arthrobacter vasquezii]
MPSTPYVANKPKNRETRDELRARIPGWGADLDPADRPSYPKERLDPSATGAHWDFPEQQPGGENRERSIEHEIVPPVFGTSVPLKGVSGVIRRHAYASYGEGRAAHWLLLILGDRVDAWESHLRSFASARPDNPVTETGVLSEKRRHGIASRFGVKRSDTHHQWIDPVLVGGPWIAAGGAAVVIVRKLARRG